MNDAVKEMKDAAENLADITPIDALLLAAWTNAVLSAHIGKPDVKTSKELIVVDLPASLAPTAVAALAASNPFEGREDLQQLVDALVDRIHKHLTEIEAGLEGDAISLELQRVQAGVLGYAMMDGLDNITAHMMGEDL